MQPEDLQRILDRLSAESEKVPRPGVLPQLAEVEGVKFGAAGDFRWLGAGGSRTAYLVRVAGEPPMVLKVLVDQGRVNQPRQELLCLLAAHENPLVPTLYAFGPSPTVPAWTLVEYLDAPAGDGDWLREAKLPLREFQHALDECWPDDEDYPRGPDCFVDSLLSYGARPAFARAFGDLMRICHPDIAELSQEQHWGVAADGSLKVIDLGLAETEAPWAAKTPEEIMRVKARLMA